MVKRSISLLLTVLMTLSLIVIPTIGVSANEFEAINIAEYVPGDKPEDTATIAGWDNGILGIDVTKNSPAYPYVRVTAPAKLDTNENIIYQSQNNTPGLGALFSIASGTLAAGETYVLSYKVTNTNPSVDATVVSAIVDGTGAMSKDNVLTTVVSGSEEQVVTKTITLAPTDVQTSKTYLRIGLGISNTHNWFRGRTDLAFVPNSEIIFDYEDIYFAPQVAYDIENTLSAGTVLPGSTVTGNAKVVNQMGDKSNLDQTMTYFVTDTNGVVAEEFAVTAGEDGSYTVNVGEGVADGDYVVLARSSAYNEGKTENFFQAPATLTIKNEDYSDTADLEVEPSLVSGVGTINNVDYGVSFANVSENIYSFQTTAQTTAAQSIDTPAGGMVWSLANKGITNGDKFVITFKVKKNSEDVVPNLVYGLVDGAMGVGYVWRAQNVYTMDVTGTDWQTVVTEATVPSDGTKNTKFILGLGVSCTRNEYNKDAFKLREGASVLVDIDSICVVKPELKGIVNEATTATDVYAGGRIEAKAAVVNSANLTAGIDQSIEYIVLDAATRKKPASGITVQVGENGNYTVNVSKSANAGEYVVVASNSTNGSVMRKGLEFTVDTLDKFTTDYTPDVQAKPATIATPAGWDNKLGITVTKNNPAYPYATVVAPAELDTSKDSAYLAANNTAAMGVQYSISSGALVGGKSYVLSYKIANINPQVDATVVSTLLDGSMKMSKNNVWTDVIAGSEEQTVTRTITLADTDVQTANTHLRIGVGIGNTHSWFRGRADLAFVPNTSFRVDYVNLYLAEEIAYDIDLETSDPIVHAGGTLDAEAAILNQCNIEGASLNQEFEWVALNSEKTDVAEGILVTYDADSSKATVSVDEDVEEGTYVIAAYNAEYNMAKSISITVSNQVAIENLELDTNNSKVTFDALNVPDGGLNVNVYIAEYSVNDLLLKQVEAVPLTLSKGNTKGVEANYTSDFNEENLIKVFVWTSELTPVYEGTEVKKK